MLEMISHVHFIPYPRRFSSLMLFVSHRLSSVIHRFIIEHRHHLWGFKGSACLPCFPLSRFPFYFVSFISCLSPAISTKPTKTTENVSTRKLYTCYIFFCSPYFLLPTTYCSLILFRLQFSRTFWVASTPPPPHSPPHPRHPFHTYPSIP
ncbi:hypothetical protein BDY19DRAFT_135034 [Irpex rosettiformis]|uniref:Uncharacterized protein n=1 Tax=Irpex rosettiformis TaxID=378272 RepID=A0ACB8U4V4_9APHY|nr:hypothetical protein BDY19DRAFT_135034 [Irpex rosettiformis]